MNWFAHMLFGGAVTILPAAVYAQTQTTTTQALSFFPLPPAQPAPAQALLARPFALRAERRGPHLELDLGPALDEILGLLHTHGIPLRQDPALAGKRGVVFSASWQMGEGDEPIRFRIGDRGPLDAFYANEGGFRVALTVPLPGLRRFAFHLEGGEDSEFGNWAIAGLQWLDPKRALVIGLGIPLAPSTVSGAVGVLCQIRMPLD